MRSCKKVPPGWLCLRPMTVSIKLCVALPSLWRGNDQSSQGLPCFSATVATLNITFKRPSHGQLPLTRRDAQSWCAAHLERPTFYVAHMRCGLHCLVKPARFLEWVLCATLLCPLKWYRLPSYEMETLAQAVGISKIISTLTSAPELLKPVWGILENCASYSVHLLRS